MGLVIIGIKRFDNGVWRVTYDGGILGDDRGYPTREAAIAEATKRAEQKDGHWEGSTWVDDTRVLHGALTGAVQPLRLRITKKGYSLLSRDKVVFTATDKRSADMFVKGWFCDDSKTIDNIKLRT